MIPTTVKVLTLALLLFGMTKSGTSIELNVLYRYWNPGSVDHFYTHSFAELGAGRNGWTYEGVAALLESKHVQGSVPLYRYYLHSKGDHFYTTDPKEIGTVTPGATGNHGYVFEGIVGYCFPNQKTGTVPFYRYFKGGVQDHFYTKSATEIGTTQSGQTGNHGYQSEGVECYVY